MKKLEAIFRHKVFKMLLAKGDIFPQNGIYPHHIYTS